MKSEQGLPHRLGHRATHVGFAMELHFAFGRVDVHIDCGGVDFQDQAADRVAAFHQRGVVTLEQREIEAAIFDGAAIDKEVLVVARGAGNARRPDESPKPEQAG